MLCLKFNRKLVRQVLNSFFSEDPKEHPELAAVLKEMGLSGDNKILGASHPLVVAAAARSQGNRTQLCSRDGSNFRTVSTHVR